MIRLAPVALSLLGALAAAAVRADDFILDLSAQAGKGAKAAAVYPLGKPRPRALLTAAPDTPITLKWTVRRTDAATVKDVLVHLFVVKEEKPDQPDLPKLNKNVAVESALTMDFRSGDRTEGTLTFTMSGPGYYLLRLELKGTAGKDGREPFAALDLLVR